MPVTPTPVPMQLIAPIPVATPSQTESPSVKNELLKINGVNEKTVMRLKKLGINNIDDLAKASTEDLEKKLKVDLPTAQKWIKRAKELQ